MFRELSSYQRSLFDDFRRIEQQLDQLFGEGYMPSGIRSVAQGTRDNEPVIRPPVDIFEDDQGITLLADMPGVSKERLEIAIDKDTLSIQGDAAIPMAEGMEAIYADVRATRYQRNFSLSSELDGEKANASLKDGVLTLQIPKRTQYQPRKIEVRVE